MSGDVRIEFAQKFTHPPRITSPVTRARKRPAPDRSRFDDQLLAFCTLLDAAPPTPALLDRFVRDISGRSGWYPGLREESRAFWTNPEDNLPQAGEFAEHLLAYGAPRGLVRDVLIAEHDGAFAITESGWRAWQTDTAAHDLVRGLLCDLAPDEEVGAELFSCIAREGYAPASLDEYASAPGDYHPQLANTLVWCVRTLFFDCEDVATDAELVAWETRLELIERASDAARGIYPDAPDSRPNAHGIQRKEKARAAEILRGWDVYADGLEDEYGNPLDDNGVADEGHNLETAADPDDEEQRVRRKTASAQGRLAQASRTLTPAERAHLAAELRIYAQDRKPTDRAVANTLGLATSHAAVRKQKERRDQKLKDAR